MYKHEWEHTKLCPKCNTDILYHLDRHGKIDRAVCDKCKWEYPSSIKGDCPVCGGSFIDINDYNTYPYGDKVAITKCSACGYIDKLEVVT